MAEAMRLQDAVTRYLERRKRQVAKTTYKNDESVVLRLQRFVGGNPWMSTIESDVVWDFFYSGSARALSATLTEVSFNKARDRVGQFVNYCERRGWVRPLLMDDVKPRTPTEMLQRRYTATELMCLCDAAPTPQEKILVALACNTALRIGDILSLRLSVLDDRGELDPSTPTVDLAGGWLRVRVHKTKKQDNLPITLELDAALRAWLTHYTVTLGRPLEHDMYLVPAQDNDSWDRTPAGATYTLKPYDRVTTQDTKFHRIAELAGLRHSRGNGWHTIRRSLARLLYEDLKRRGHPDPIRPVQAMLHHTDPGMTYRYIGTAPDRQDRDEMLRGVSFLGRLAADTSNVTVLRVVEQ